MIAGPRTPDKRGASRSVSERPDAALDLSMTVTGIE